MDEEVLKHNLTILLRDYDFEEREVEEHEKRKKELKKEIIKEMAKQGKSFLKIETSNGEVEYDDGEVHITTY